MCETLELCSCVTIVCVCTILCVYLAVTNYFYEGKAEFELC